MSAGLVLGVISGLSYGLLAVGIVLIYKANRFLNLAHAQLGAVSALLLGRLVLEDGWSWWAAFPVVVAVGAVTGLLIERLVVRPMLRQRRQAVSFLLVTIGVAQLLLALTFVQGLGPSSTSLFREGYPVPLDVRVETGSLLLRGEHVLVLVLVPAVVLGLAAFLRWSTWGKTIRAAASNPEAAMLCGIPVQRVSMLAWGLAGALSAVTAVLQAPSQESFNAAALGPGLLLASLGAAAFGGFTSIPAALAGGLLIGIVENVTLDLTGDAGPAQLVVLLTVLAVLVVRGRVIGTALGGADASASETQAPVRIPEAVRSRFVVRHSSSLLGAAALAVALLAPLLPFFTSDPRRFQLIVILVFAVAGVSLTMLVGWAGQVSLGHFALLGLGAFLTAKLEPKSFSLFAILLVAGVAGAALMALVGLPALRLRGFTLAITTLGLAVVAPAWLFQQSWLGGAEGQNAVVVEPPGYAGLGRLDDKLSVYYAALALLVVALRIGVRLRSSHPGRLILAVRDNERALSSYGVTPATVKLTVLALSGALVSMAGVLWGTAWQTMSVDLVPPEASLVLIAIPVIGGLGSLSGAVAGAVFLYGSSFYLSPLVAPLFGDFGKQVGFQLAVAGLGLVVMPLLYPAGLAGAGRELWQRFLLRLAAQVQEAAPQEDDAAPLVVRGVHKRFGGRVVLDGVELEVRRGEIVGLIGPNGAGKTTLMNVVSGDLVPDAGSVHLFGRDVTALPSYDRAHFGLGRNYQEASLFPGLTTREVLQVALGRQDRTGTLSAAIGAPWAKQAERRARRRADEVLRRLGLEPWADTLTGDLSTGTRRIVELAAQLASGPKVLLLDEPTAGVAQRDAEAFGPLLRQIREELDCSILLIEHDMPLLMSVCDRVYALERGSVIAEGTPEEIREHPAVVSSYLGSGDSVAVTRSGAVPAGGR